MEGRKMRQEVYMRKKGSGDGKKQVRKGGTKER